MSYTEDTLVQQTTADYLEQPLGWKVDHWRDQESTRDAVRVAIRDYL